MENPDVPRIPALADDGQEWLAARLTVAEEAGQLAGPGALIGSFDNSRGDWHAKLLGERGSAAMPVNIYSAAIGQVMSEEFDLE